MVHAIEVTCYSVSPFLDGDRVVMHDITWRVWKHDYARDTVYLY